MGLPAIQARDSGGLRRDFFGNMGFALSEISNMSRAHHFVPRASVFATAFFTITIAFTQMQTSAAQYETGNDGTAGTHWGTLQSAPNNLSKLVTTALAQGQSVAYADALLNEAAASGKITVPDAFKTADGRIDTGRVLTMLGNAPTIGASDISGPTSTVLALIPDQFRFQTDSLDQERNAMVAPGQIAIGQRLTIPAH